MRTRSFSSLSCMNNEHIILHELSLVFISNRRKWFRLGNIFKIWKTASETAHRNRNSITSLLRLFLLFIHRAHTLTSKPSYSFQWLLHSTTARVTTVTSNLLHIMQLLLFLFPAIIESLDLSKLYYHCSLERWYYLVAVSVSVKNAVEVTYHRSVLHVAMLWEVLAGPSCVENKA